MVTAGSLGAGCETIYNWTNPSRNKLAPASRLGQHAGILICRVELERHLAFMGFIEDGLSSI